MADKPKGDRTEPTLELPSLRLPGLGRRKRAGRPATPSPDAPSAGRSATAAPATSSAENAPAGPTQEPAGSPTDPGAEAPSSRPVHPPKLTAADGVTRRTGAPTPSSGPVLPPYAAATLTGLLVGVVGVLLTLGSMRGCEAVQGTSSCGKGPGFLLLVGIVAVMAVTGAALLHLLRVHDAPGTSLLGVGTLCVVVLVALTQAVYSAWVFVAVPVLCAATFVLARWVTTRMVDTTEPGPGHDVR